MHASPVLFTPRLILRSPEPDDAPTVQRLAGDFAIADTTSRIPHPYTLEHARNWIAESEKKMQAGELVNFAIVLREMNELIGGIGLVINAQSERAELGYWIGKPYWSHGYCTEAVRAMFDFGFGVMQLNRIYAWHFSRNPASGRVMEKLGMTHEGHVRQGFKKWDKFEDLELYGILREDWERMVGDQGQIERK